MAGVTDVKSICKVLDQLKADLAALEETGKGIPAIEKNAVRMRGALRQLEVQFKDLEDSIGGI